MTINQISIFLENKLGRLGDIFGILAQGHIKVVAATVADTSDYGILRLITNNQQRAAELLRAANVTCNLNEVLAVRSDSHSGEFAANIKPFMEAGINIEYMYCFTSEQRQVMVLRSNDMEGARRVANANKLHCLSPIELAEI